MSNKQPIDLKIPEDTWIDHLLRYGLGFGAIFQLVCVFAIIFLSPNKSAENNCSELDATFQSHDHLSHSNSHSARKHWHGKRKHEKKKRK